MPTTDTSEKGLEIIITDWLIEHNCYERGALYGVGEYNKDFAVDETRLFRFLANTQPTEWAKLHLDELPNGKKAFLTYLSEKLSKEGVIELLRKEFRYKQAKLYLFWPAIQGQYYCRGIVEQEYIQCHSPVTVLKGKP